LAVAPAVCGRTTNAASPRRVHAGEYRAHRRDVDDCLKKRLARGGHQGRQHRVYLAPGEIAKVTDGRVRRTAERKRRVVLAAVAIN
jgi:hypothetical protein